MKIRWPYNILYIQPNQVRPVLKFNLAKSFSSDATRRMRILQSELVGIWENFLIRYDGVRRNFKFDESAERIIE